MKYYMIKTYTPYCGEHNYHYLAIPDCDNIDDDKYLDWMMDRVNDTATDWWDEESAEEFDGDYDEYLANCGYDLYEITEEEFNAEGDGDIPFLY